MAAIGITGDMSISVCAMQPITAAQERELMGECVFPMAMYSPVVTVTVRRDKTGRITRLECQNAKGVVGQINFCSVTSDGKPIP